MNASKPHVFVITCHDLGQHLGCYGVGSVRSPHLDRLAATGARFEHAFCTAPQCSPSRASLATGRYPHSHGVMGLSHGGFDGDLPSQERHTAARPAVCGYETHLFGLQHVTQNAVDGGDVEDALLEGPIAAPRYRLALQGRPSTPRGSVGATG